MSAPNSMNGRGSRPSGPRRRSGAASRVLAVFAIALFATVSVVAVIYGAMAIAAPIVEVFWLLLQVFIMGASLQ